MKFIQKLRLKNFASAILLILLITLSSSMNLKADAALPGTIRFFSLSVTRTGGSIDDWDVPGNNVYTQSANFQTGSFNAPGRGVFIQHFGRSFNKPPIVFLECNGVQASVANTTTNGFQYGTFDTVTCRYFAIGN